MAHMVETMFSVREKPWHYASTKELTKILQEAPMAQDAIRLAGLDWTVNKQPVFDANGKQIPGYAATTRDSDSSVLGIVSTKYQVVQNSEAFDFTDALLGQGGISYETAGSLKGGRTVWLLGKLDEQKILGDKFEPYVCFTNSHDGTGAIRVCMTPVRVVCNNTLNLALGTAKRNWSAPHLGNIQLKLSEARETLGLANAYMAALAREADALACQKMTVQDTNRALDQLFPYDEDASDITKRHAEENKQAVMYCMLAPDLVNFLNTKWGFVNAVADFVGHSEPSRHTAGWQENRWGNIISGHRILDRAMAIVK